MEILKPAISEDIPRMGSHMVLDFVDVTSINVGNAQEVNKLVKDVLSKLKIEQIQECAVQYDEEKGLSQMVMLDNGHLVVHTNWEERSLSVDFYYSIYHSHDEKLAGLKMLEVFLCDTLGWQNSRQVVVVPRGYTTKIFFHETNLYSLILQQVDFLQREKTQFGDLRVYNSQEKGIMLLNDSNLIFTNELKCRYSQDLYQNTIQEGTIYDNVLILGGADLQIAAKLLQNDGVKQVSVVEEDEMVYFFTKKYFQVSKDYSNHKNIKKIIKLPLDFVTLSVQQGSQYDIIYVDYKLQWTSEKLSPEYSSQEFYNNVFNLLKPNGQFTQMIGKNESVQNYEQLLLSVGFKNVKFILSPTTTYSEELKLLIVSK